MSLGCGGVANSRGRSSSPEGLTATEGIEVARLDRGADTSDGGEPGVSGEARSTGDERFGLVMAETYFSLYGESLLKPGVSIESFR